MDDIKAKVSGSIPETNNLQPPVDNITKNIENVKGGFSGEDIGSVLCPPGGGFLTTETMQARENPSFMPDGRREIGGRVVFQGGLPPINLTVYTNSQFLNQSTDFDTLIQALQRDNILYYRLSEIYHSFSEYFNLFNDKMGVSSELVWERFENVNTGDKKTFAYPEENDRRKNLYAAVTYWQKLVKKFERFERVRGDAYLMYTFTIPDNIVEKWDHKKMVNVRRKLARLLRSYGLYQFVIVFHFWGDKNPLKRNLHFHVLIKTNRRMVPEGELKKKWAKILKYDGVPVIDLKYTYNEYKARHFYEYITRSYLYDVFLYWLKGGYIDFEEVKGIIDYWQGKRMQNIEFYGYLKKKDIEQEKEWKKLYRVTFEGYIQKSDGRYAIFSYEDPEDWGVGCRKKYEEKIDGFL